LNLPETISECHELIKQLVTIVEVLQREIQDLKQQANQNSRNSHRPPSSDGLGKPAFPASKKGKRGGQSGHSGKTLKMIEAADTIHVLKPGVCQGCQQVIGLDTPMIFLGKRLVFDLPAIQLEVTEYQRFGCTCTQCGHQNNAEFPAGVTGPVQYGPRVNSLVTLLYQSGCMSVAKVQTLFNDLFDSPLNEATIQKCQLTAFDRLDAEENYIKSQLQTAPVVNAGESGIRCEGKLFWLYEIDNARLTHQFVHERRGMAAHEDENALLKHLKVWLVHDCCSLIYCKHAVCNAHLLRELKALEETGRKWAKDFHAFLMGIYSQTEQGKSKLLEQEYQSVILQYQCLLDNGYAEESPPVIATKKGKPKKTKGRNLLERLDMHWEGVQAFANHTDVPFTNNLAERDIRPAKSKIKVAGCFRTIQGAQAYARIHGFISTVRKHQYNPFNELINVFSGLTPQYRAATT
jgi:transposase